MGSERDGRSSIHLDGHPLLDFLYEVFLRASFNNLPVLFPEMVLQRLNLLAERVKCGREPIPVGFCFIRELVQL